jgi:hypothetical protein
MIKYYAKKLKIKGGKLGKEFNEDGIDCTTFFE